MIEDGIFFGRKSDILACVRCTAALLSDPSGPRALEYYKCVRATIAVYGWSFINNKYHRLRPAGRVDNFRNPMEAARVAMCVYRAALSDTLPVLKHKGAAEKYLNFRDFHRVIGNDKVIEAIENTLWRDGGWDSPKNAAFFTVWALYFTWVQQLGKVYEDAMDLPLDGHDARVQILSEKLFDQPEASAQGSFRSDLENSLLGIHVGLGRIERFIEDEPEAKSFHLPYYLEDEPGPELRTEIDMAVKGVLEEKTFASNPDHLDICLLRLFHLWMVRFTDKRVPWADDHLIEWWELGDVRKKRLLDMQKYPTGELRRPIVLHLGSACFWVHDSQWADSVRIYKARTAAHALSIWTWLVVNSKGFDGRFASHGSLPAEALELFRERRQRSAADGDQTKLSRARTSESECD